MSSPSVKLPGSAQLAEMFLTIAADKLKSLQSIRENDEQWTETDAVSYTHLDVYKRQGERVD